MCSITCVWNVSVQSHVSALAYILTGLQECDITEGNRKEVHRVSASLPIVFKFSFTLRPHANSSEPCSSLLQKQTVNLNSRANVDI